MSREHLADSDRKLRGEDGGRHIRRELAKGGAWPKPREQLQREPPEEEPRAGEENQAKPEEERFQL